MPDINNSVALGIKNDPIDIAGTLAKAAAIRDTNAHADIQQQSYAEREREYGENGGLTSGQRATMNDTQQKAIGAVGNIWVNDQSGGARKQGLDMLDRAGVPLDTMTRAHLATAPAPQLKQYGQNAQRIGQSSSTNIEQDPSKINQRNFAGASGSSRGTIHGETDPDQPGGPSAPPLTQPQVNSAINTRTNANGSPRVFSLNGNVPVQPGAPAAPVAPTSPLQRKNLQAAQGTELSGNAQKNVEEFAGYKQAAMNSPTTKQVLHALQDDSDRVFTGKGAPQAAEARKWVQSAQQLPGIGGMVRYFSGDNSDPVAAFENIRKNAGLIARSAMGDVHGTAASELDAVTKSLPTEETSNKGLKIATSQLMAVEDFKQARLQAAQSWKNSHGDSLNGFSADWSKNMGPAAFVVARLPTEERTALKERLNKTPEGKRTLDSINRQLKWGHDNGLDSVID